LGGSGGGIAATLLLCTLDVDDDELTTARDEAGTFTGGRETDEELDDAGGETDTALNWLEDDKEVKDCDAADDVPLETGVSLEEESALVLCEESALDAGNANDDSALDAGGSRGSVAASSAGGSLDGTVDPDTLAGTSPVCADTAAGCSKPSTIQAATAIRTRIRDNERRMGTVYSPTVQKPNDYPETLFPRSWQSRGCGSRSLRFAFRHSPCGAPCRHALYCRSYAEALVPVAFGSL